MLYSFRPSFIIVLGAQVSFKLWLIGLSIPLLGEHSIIRCTTAAESLHIYSTNYGDGAYPSSGIATKIARNQSLRSGRSPAGTAKAFNSGGATIKIVARFCCSNQACKLISSSRPRPLHTHTHLSPPSSSDDGLNFRRRSQSVVIIPSSASKSALAISCR